MRNATVVANIPALSYLFLSMQELEVSSDGYVNNWVKFCKQGVFFIHEPRDVGGTSANSKLKYTVTFEPSNGSLTMQCNIVGML